MLVSLLRFQGWAIPAGFGLVVLFQMLTRRINTAGLLGTSARQPINLMQVQLLMATLVAAVSYMQLVAASLSSRVATLPEPSRDMLLLLAGSQLAYLSGTAASCLDWFSFPRSRT